MLSADAVSPNRSMSRREHLLNKHLYLDVERNTLSMFTNQYLMQRYWWVLALRGLIAVLFGIAALLWPGLTILALIIIFGAYALVDGVMAVIVSLQERKVLHSWWV